MTSSRDYLKMIVSGLVESPDDVEITEENDSLGTLLYVSVARRDMGKVLGKGGLTIKAIRHVMNSHGFTQQSKVSVKVLEPLPA